MKKFIALTAALLALVLVFTACAAKPENEEITENKEILKSGENETEEV